MAGVPGLEPRLTEPESVVLPITPYPTATCGSRPEVPVSDGRPRSAVSGNRIRGSLAGDAGAGGEAGREELADEEFREVGEGLDDVDARGGGGVVVAAVEPDAVQAGVLGADGVDVEAVADVDRFGRGDVQLVAGGVEDRRVGFGAAELAGDDDGVEEAADAKVAELGAL